MKSFDKEALLGKTLGWIVLFVILSFSLGELNIPQHFFWQQRPGALFEKQHYTTSVYVLVYPNAYGTKHYRLKGLITRENTCDPNSDVGVSDGYDQCELVYSLLEFKWPNGGYAPFDACIIDFQRPKVTLGFGLSAEDFGCTSNNHVPHTYYIQLTKELVT